MEGEMERRERGEATERRKTVLIILRKVGFDF